MRDLSKPPDIRTRKLGGRDVNVLGLDAEQDILARSIGFRSYAHLESVLMSGGPAAQAARAKLEAAASDAETRAADARKRVSELEEELKRRENTP